MNSLFEPNQWRIISSNLETRKSHWWISSDRKHNFDKLRNGDYAYGHPCFFLAEEHFLHSQMSSFFLQFVDIPVQWFGLLSAIDCSSLLKLIDVANSPRKYPSSTTTWCPVYCGEPIFCPRLWNAKISSRLQWDRAKHSFKVVTTGCPLWANAKPILRTALPHPIIQLSIDERLLKWELLLFKLEVVKVMGLLTIPRKYSKIYAFLNK